jgi:opacity protein-like surface antigen
MKTPKVLGVDARRAKAWKTAFVAFMGLFVSVGSSDAAAPEAVEPDYDRPGWYIGIGSFAAIPDFDLTTDDLGVVPPQPANTDPDFDSRPGIDFRVGYRLAPRWSLEFDYQWQQGFQSRNPDVAPIVEIDTHLLSLNAKFFLLKKRWQPYGLLGASLLIFNTEIFDDQFKKPWNVDYGFAPRFGGGLDFYISEHWIVYAEGTYIVPVGVTDGANMGTVGGGFQYRF